MRNRGSALVIGVALSLALGLAVLAAAPPSINDSPSSRVSGRAGTLALYTWLSQLGFATHRVAGDFSVDGTDVLVVSQPTTSFTAAEASRVVQMLDNGSDLIVAVDDGSSALAQPLLAALQVSLDVLRVQGSSTPAQPFDAGDRVHSVPMAAGLGIDPAPYLTPLLVQGSTLTAVAETVGAGRAYVLASPFPLSNDGLRDGDSATLLLSLLERSRGGHIGFDEYHHGEQANVASGAAAIFVSPLGLALLLIVGAVVLALGVRGRRLGPAITGDTASGVPTTASYIEAMASLVARSDDRGAVAIRYADELRARIGPDVGLTAGASDAELVDAVTERRPDLGRHVAEILARARRLGGMRSPPSQLLALSRDVDDLERAWTEPVTDTTGSAQ